MEQFYTYDQKTYAVNVEKEGDHYLVTIGSRRHRVSVEEVHKGYLKLYFRGKFRKPVVAEDGAKRIVFLNGGVYQLTRSDGPPGAEGKKEGGSLASPISGKVVKVNVRAGDTVKEGESIMAIEAMKMEYEVKAPFDGVVNRVNFPEGGPVGSGDALADMSATGPREEMHEGVHEVGTDTHEDEVIR